MAQLFPNQDYGREVLKHVHLPVYITAEFNFYRCLAMKDGFYGIRISDLFADNLRKAKEENRHACLFKRKKVSYWSDSPQTARAEVQYHCKEAKGFITFGAYDDATSTFPTLPNREPLIIADGRATQFSAILEKSENGEVLTDSELQLIEDIESQNLDCLAYSSKRRNNGVNYLFFEKGFEKLALREVTLRYKRREGGSHCAIVCATTSDYSPIPQNYGCLFAPKARVKMDSSYMNSEEFLSRKAHLEESRRRIK